MSPRLEQHAVLMRHRNQSTTALREARMKVLSMLKTERTYTTAQVLPKFHGDITERMLQHWSDTGIIVPRIESHKRRYTDKQIGQIYLCLKLREKGISTIKIRRLLPEIVSRILRGDAAFLVTNGREFSITTKAETAIAFMCRHKGGWHLIDLRELESPGIRRRTI